MALPTTRDVHVDAALTDLSIAYRQDAPAYADRIFPIVSVGKQSDKYFEWNKGDMWRRNAQKRAPGTSFARAGMRLSTNTFFSEQYSLEYLIPDEVRRNSDSAINPERTGTFWLMDQLNLEKDYQWATNFMSSGAGWTSGTVSVAKWETATGVPVSDVQYWRHLIQQQIGSSNQHRFVGVCGSIVKSRLIGNAQVRNSSIYVQVGTAQAVNAGIAAILGIDDLVVFDRMYNTAKENATASYSALADDDFLLVAVPRSPGIDVPSAGYSFQWNDGNGDMYVESYRDEPNKSDVIRSINYFDLVQTGSALGVFCADVCD